MKSSSGRSGLKIYWNVYSRRKDWRLLETRSKALEPGHLQISLRRWCFWSGMALKCGDLRKMVCI